MASSTMTTTIPPLSSASIGSLALPSGSQSQNLLLDSSIRDWVVLPLLVIMIAAGLLRHYVGILLRSSTVTKIPRVEHRVKNALSRASRLRSGGAGFLSKVKWEGRRCYWVDKDEGYLKEEIDWVEEEADEKGDNANGDGAGGGANDDMPNPMAMMDGMKGQFVFMAQNMIMMQGISYFFQGFVLLKVPFPLTQGFKMMFQRGLDLTTLETSYVSSVSWYFLVMFGLRSFFRLVIGDGGSGGQEGYESGVIQTDLGVTTGGGNLPPGQNFDAARLLKAETENLELARYKGCVDDAEKRLLGKRYPKRKIVSGIGGNPGDDIFGYGSVSTKNTKKVKASSKKKN